MDRQGVLWVATMVRAWTGMIGNTPIPSFTTGMTRVIPAVCLITLSSPSTKMKPTRFGWVPAPGCCCFDGTRGAFFTYRSRRNDPFSLGVAHVQGIALDARSTGLLWIATQDSGVKVPALRNRPFRPACR